MTVQEGWEGTEEGLLRGLDALRCPKCSGKLCTEFCWDDDATTLHCSIVCKHCALSASGPGETHAEALEMALCAMCILIQDGCQKMCRGECG